MDIVDTFNKLHPAERDFVFTHPLAAAVFNANAKTAGYRKHKPPF